MKERPILFNGAMVRAILAGKKTQTRRVVKQLDPKAGAVTQNMHGKPMGCCWAFGGPVIHCPFGKPGDRLWVREAWAQRGEWRLPSWPEADFEDSYWDGTKDVIYTSDAKCPEIGWRGRPSIHMPRWASRITLEITGVRVERLNECSEADAQAEGVIKFSDNFINGLPGWEGYDGALPRPDAISAYTDLWEKINGEFSWDLNPWVWVVEFKRVVP